MTENRFKRGEMVEHVKGGYYTIEAEPDPNYLLEYNREPYYIYTKNGEKSTRWVRAKNEMEDGRFAPVVRKLSIQKKGKKVIAGLFYDFNCIRDFMEFDTEADAINNAHEYFGTEHFQIVRPTITKMKVS